METDARMSFLMAFHQKFMDLTSLAGQLAWLLCVRMTDEHLHRAGHAHMGPHACVGRTLSTELSLSPSQGIEVKAMVD